MDIIRLHSVSGEYGPFSDPATLRIRMMAIGAARCVPLNGKIVE